MRHRFILLYTALAFISISVSFPTGNDGCEGMIREPKESPIKLPLKYEKFHHPWHKGDNHSSVLYKSPKLTYNWNWFKELKIQGLDTTLSNLIQLLDQHDCYFVGYGKGIKNIVIGAIKDRSLLEIEGESTCNAFKLQTICLQYFGEDNCSERPITGRNPITFGNGNILKLNDEQIIGPITIHSWGATYPSTRLDMSYTANHGGIFDDGFGNTRFIDTTGESQHDICHKRIVIPTQQSFWESWCKINLQKTLEFYNIVADGFDAKQDVHDNITDAIIKSFDPVIFQKYYCKSVLGGEYTPSYAYSSHRKALSICRYLTPDPRRSRLIGLINATLQEDLGNFWRTHASPALNAMQLFKSEGRAQRPINIAFDYQARVRQSTAQPKYRPPYVKEVTEAPSYFTTQEPPHQPQYEYTSFTTGNDYAVKYFNHNDYPHVPAKETPPEPEPLENHSSGSFPRSSDKNRGIYYLKEEEIPFLPAKDYS